MQIFSPTLLFRLCLGLLPAAGLPLDRCLAEKSTVIVDDKFADAERAQQSPPLGTPPYSSLAWYSNVQRWVKPDNTGLTLGATIKDGAWAGSVLLWGYFAPVGSPIELNEGESIRLTFDYTYSVEAGNADFRFGLFDTGGEAPQSNGAAFDHADLKGYTVQADVQRSSSPKATIFAKDNKGKTGAAFGAGGGSYSPLGGPLPVFDAGTDTHTAQLTITRNKEGMAITLNMDTKAGDGAPPVQEHNIGLHAFNAVAFYHGKMKEGETLRIGNIRIETLSP